MDNEKKEKDLMIEVHVKDKLFYQKNLLRYGNRPKNGGNGTMGIKGGGKKK